MWLLSISMVLGYLRHIDNLDNQAELEEMQIKVGYMLNREYMIKWIESK